MIDLLLQQCKHQRQAFNNSKLVMLTEPDYQHSDFLLLGWMVKQLSADKKITFLAFRQNYAHYISLSKKIGKSLEGFIKSNKLTYYECFESPFCSELPLVESQPSTYTPPSTLAHKLHPKDVMHKKDFFLGADWVVVDSISYIEDTIDLCYWIYEQAMLSGSRLLLGGCDQQSEMTALLKDEAEVIIELTNDVGGFGKIKVNNETVMWRSVKGQVQFSQQIVI